MSADLFVKICGITSEADALLCVSFGADAVGFIWMSRRNIQTFACVLFSDRVNDGDVISASDGYEIATGPGRAVIDAVLRAHHVIVV